MFCELHDVDMSDRVWIFFAGLHFWVIQP